MMAHKKVINHNYEHLINIIHKEREKEKETVTEFLKDMTDEQREVQNLHKQLKIGNYHTDQQWVEGLQEKDITDQVRDDTETQTLLESSIENDLDTSGRGAMYIAVMEEKDRLLRVGEIEKEEYSLSHLPDDDDYGDRDGDEGY